MLFEKIAKKRTRSSKGTRESVACAKTRSLNFNQLKSRLKKLAGTLAGVPAELDVAELGGLDDDIGFEPSIFLMGSILMY